MQEPGRTFPAANPGLIPAQTCPSISFSALLPQKRQLPLMSDHEPPTPASSDALQSI